ncbi:4-hydroxy-3-methylbut-2-en-1-yl diphosphate synthase [Sulfitobacter noctilucae]|uniref:helix-turn-helix domain-containing protein n=1 Tax=Sulfitobacter noctilucae TaxID=1342302 RepID=UPI000469AA07|nr:helix-turn-helix domain-containing protein [Sulfitobacter noctilucae]KIN60841.1 4-hydroxy-3-methylbut-2-en-1-yl diphosphate synthase [Sulfitobacter noctilucae]
MIGRWASKAKELDVSEPKGFDAFDLRLGDVMRGERATLGKSLLDVQRELRIKASYIAAIENADPDAFDTPGFIAGYVRSYARYLGMDPDKAFATFCTESGFEVAHGMSAQASVVKKPAFEDRKKRPSEADLFARPNTPFTPAGDSFLSRIEPGAVGSMLVLVTLIGAIGFGGYTVLQEVQRVQVAPVDQTPVVLSDLDPVEGALGTAGETDTASAAPRAIEAPRVEALDRLYRPQALDVPVMVARDAPIATIDPRAFGNFASPDPVSAAPAVVTTAALSDTDMLPGMPQVVETAAAGVRMVAAYPSWVRVRAADGTVIFEGVMDKGDTWDVPATEEPPTLRTGESGALYFAMGTGCYGPVGARGSITSNLPLNQQALAELYTPVDPTADQSLSRMFADLSSTDIDPAVLAAIPCQTN